jgi:hypothetical protein
MNLETESLLVALEAELTIAGRKLKCAKYQGSVKGGSTGTVTSWISSEIPGGVARTETELKTAGTMTIKMVMETLDFEVKK